ncbi:hypothetical protein TNCV_3751251 [Trichonephila clavipes]|uniref:Uncharacterized protein n=1 Tax=Trichonephila clavipes TaxID=2585209 RepID=A0A8X6UWN2_TRICX|nr:hypothetical protein TNCV_3751251 [Trichonephila clavipes]
MQKTVFQMLNDDEIGISCRNDEKDEGEDNNESSKGPSNGDAFSALEIAIEWYTNNRVLSYSTTAQENRRPCSKKTVYNGTAKNK